MRVYHFLSNDFGEEAIKKQRLKISQINQSNDPFEWLAVDARKPEIRQYFLNERKRKAKETGILCFSKNRDNPVQWGHYADKHKGLCLGFDIEDELLREVNYNKTRMSDEFISDQEWPEEDRQKKIKQMLCTKSIDWQYEQELRWFTSLTGEKKDGKHYFQPFNDDFKLSEVFVGHSNPISRAELSEVIGERSIKTRKMRLSFRDYRVVIQQTASLWK